MSKILHKPDFQTISLDCTPGGQSTGWPKSVLPHRDSSCPLPEHTVPQGQTKACLHKGITPCRLLPVLQPLSSAQSSL